MEKHIALFVVAAFVIDRVVNHALMLLGLNRWWARWFPDPAESEDAGRPRAEKKQKLAYFVLTASLGGLLAVWDRSFGIVSYMPGDFGVFDFVVNGVALMGGSAVAGEAFEFLGKASERATEVEGTLELQQPRAAARSRGKERPREKVH